MLAAAAKHKRKLVAIAFGASSLVAVAGLAHVPAVSRLFGAKGCPWDGKPPSAKVLEDFRVKSAANMRTAQTAAARPAFGFALDRTTKTEVSAWAGQHGFACTEELGGAGLRCEKSEGDGLRDAFFRFDPTGALVGVDVVHAGTTAARAATDAATLATTIEREAGAAAAVRGVASEAHLAGGRLSQVAMEFRFTDYAADVTATNFARTPEDTSNVVVREQYRSLATKAH